MGIRQATWGFNAQWENSFPRNVNLIRDSRVMPDKVKEKLLKEANILTKSRRSAFGQPSLLVDSVILWRVMLNVGLEPLQPRGMTGHGPRPSPGPCVEHPAPALGGWPVLVFVPHWPAQASGGQCQAEVPSSPHA